MLSFMQSERGGLSMPDMMRTLTWVALVGSVAGAMVCVLGLLQAGSIYTGERAEQNLIVWGGLLVTACLLIVTCVVALCFPRKT
jgi:hypothetical protein